MIKVFRHRGLKRFYERGDRSPIRPDLLPRVTIILAQLDQIEQIEDMDLHSFHLHALRGSYQGYWSVTVRANWRIIFRFEGGKVFDVELMAPSKLLEPVVSVLREPLWWLSIRSSC
jgi:toxin HigB-1